MPDAVAVEPHHRAGQHGGSQQRQQQQPWAAGTARFVGKAFLALVIGSLVVTRIGARPRRCILLEHLVEIVLGAAAQGGHGTAETRGGAALVVQLVFGVFARRRFRLTGIGVNCGGAAHRKAGRTEAGRLGAEAGPGHARKAWRRHIARAGFGTGRAERRLRARTEVAIG